MPTDSCGGGAGRGGLEFYGDSLWVNIITLWELPLFRISATDQRNIEAEKRGSTEAEPSQVMDISLVFMVDLLCVCYVTWVNM